MDGSNPFAQFAPVPSPRAKPDPEDVTDEELFEAIAEVESNNNPAAVSEAGAVGTMQTMPKTLKDPGFGVVPARDDSDAERTRVGRDYAKAMRDRYGNLDDALRAYHAGPGNFDRGTNLGDVNAAYPGKVKDVIRKNRIARAMTPPAPTPNTAAAAEPANPFQQFAPAAPEVAEPRPFRAPTVDGGEPVADKQSLGGAMLNAPLQSSIDQAASIFTRGDISTQRRNKRISRAREALTGGEPLTEKEFHNLIMRSLYGSNPEVAARNTFIRMSDRRALVEGFRLLREDPNSERGRELLERFEKNAPKDVRDRLKKFAEETFPVAPEHRDKLPVELASGAGSIATFILTRLATGPAGLGLMAGSTGYDEAVSRARANGVTDPDDLEAIGKWGVLPGMTDLIPVERLFRLAKLGRFDRNAVIQWARESLEQGMIEGAQEGTQQAFQNLIEQATTNSDREWEDGVARNGLVGFILGVITGGLAGGVRQLRGRGEEAPPPVSAPPPDPAPAPEPVIEPETPVAPPVSEPETVPPVDTPTEQDASQRPPQGQESAYTPGGQEVPVTYEVVELDDLIPSQTDDMANNPAFPPELQPRDRTRAASEAQITNIANNLNPELLGQSATTGEGAPMVGPDNVVESGNARVLALRRADRTQYEEWLRSQGHSTEGFRNPVLIRRTPEMETEARLSYIRDSNARSTASMGESEQGTVDASAINADLMNLYRGGKITAADNREFIRQFIEGVIPATERGGLMTADGQISQAGIQRIRNAIFARAYEEPELLASLREDQDSNFKAIGTAMGNAAPAWVRMRSEIEAGNVPPQFDVTPHLLEALRMVRAQRQNRGNIRDIVNQDDLISGQTAPEVEAILRMFFRNDKFTQPRAGKAIGDMIERYANEAMKQRADQGTMFGEDSVTPIGILNTVSEPQPAMFSEAAFQEGGNRRGLPENQSDGGSAPVLAVIARHLGTGAAAKIPNEELHRIREIVETSRVANEDMSDGMAAVEIFEAAPTLVHEIAPTWKVNNPKASKKAHRAKVQPVLLRIVKDLRAEMGRDSRSSDSAMQIADEAPTMGAAEEDTTAPENIINPIDRDVTDEAKVDQLEALTDENVPIIDDVLDTLRAQGMEGKASRKKRETIIAKSKRPEELARKPWFAIEHIRDSYRFKVTINSFEDAKTVLDTLASKGIGVIKYDHEKMFAPKPWGWRFGAVDLRMPNGQIVEFYFSLPELMAYNSNRGHKLFEEWRDMDLAALAGSTLEGQFISDLDESAKGYRAAFDQALTRLGVSEEEASRSWASAFESSRSTISQPASSIPPSVAPSREADSQAPVSPSRRNTPSGRNNTSSPVSGSLNANIDESPTGDTLNIDHPTRDIKGDDDRALRRAPVPGSNYVGRKPENEYEPRSDISADNVKRREDVLRPLMKWLDLPVYKGRVPKKWAGFARRKANLIRARNDSDLEVVIHEVAHILDFTRPDIRKLWDRRTDRGQRTHDELLEISYDNEMVDEGWAEFIRLWATQPGEAQARAPLTWQQWADMLDADPDMAEAMNGVRDRAMEWFDQDPLSRAVSKMGEVDAINDAGNASMGDRIRTYALDDLHGAERALGMLYGDATQVSGYNVARLTRGAPKIVEGAHEFGAPAILNGEMRFVDLSGEASYLSQETDGGFKLVDNPNYTKAGLNEIYKEAASGTGSLEQWGWYMVGRRAEFLKAQGRENLFTNAEIRAMKALGEGRPEFDRAAKMYAKFNSQLLDFAEQHGQIIDGRGRDQWETDVYIPFYRVAAGDKNVRAGKRESRGETYGIMRLKGGTANIGNPIMNIEQNTRMLIEASIYANARRQIVDDIMGAENSARFMAKINRDSTQVRALTQAAKQGYLEALAEKLSNDAKIEMFEGSRDPAEIADEASEKMLTAVELADQLFDNGPDWFKLWLHNQAPAGNKVIAIMRGGRAHYYEFPQGQQDMLLWEAFQALPRGYQMNGYVRWMNAFRAVKQWTVTHTLSFVWRNVLRDPVHAAVISEYGHVPFVTAAQGLMSRIRKDPYYQDYMASGAGFGTHYEHEASTVRRKQFYEDHGIPYNRVIDSAHKVAQTVDEIFNMFEEASRIGEVRRAANRGAGQVKRGIAGREITTDFAMQAANDVMKSFYNHFAFLHAGVEGLYRTYRGLTQDRPRNHAWRNMAVMGSFSASLWFWNSLNPMYDEEEDWVKDTHWLFYIPTPAYFEWLSKHGSFEPGNIKLMPDTVEEAKPLFAGPAMLPKPWEIGMIGGTIIENSLQLLFGQDGPNGREPGSMKDFAKDQGRAVYDIFRTPSAPAMLQPIIEAYIDYNFFTGNTVISRSQKDIQYAYQSAPFTSRTLKAFGELTAKTGYPDMTKAQSPQVLEHLIRGWTSNIGMFGLTLADRAMFDGIPDLPFERMPGVRVFARPGPNPSVYQRKFWDMANKTERAYRTARQYAVQSAERSEDAKGIAEAKLKADLHFIAYAHTRKQKAKFSKLTRLSNMIAEAPSKARLAELVVGMRKMKADGDLMFQGDIDRLRRSDSWQDQGWAKLKLIQLITVQKNKHMRRSVKLAEKRLDEARRGVPMERLSEE